nr:exo-beta-N-acetylmuramidase NamZ domain-containing protein [Haladaptatus sp. R4]
MDTRSRESRKRTSGWSSSTVRTPSLRSRSPETESTRTSSFVGGYELPIVHGLTVGELATYFNGEFDMGADVEVVEMRDWSRSDWFSDTDLPWVYPSPNMPTPGTATLYPGMCFFEGTTLSEGRGTTKPFELVGAPWIDGDEWASELSSQDLDGVAFRPAYFSPTFSKHERRERQWRADSRPRPGHRRSRDGGPDGARLGVHDVRRSRVDRLRRRVLHRQVGGRKLSPGDDRRRGRIDRPSRNRRNHREQLGGRRAEFLDARAEYLRY